MDLYVIVSASTGEPLWSKVTDQEEAERIAVIHAVNSGTVNLLNGPELAQHLSARSANGPVCGCCGNSTIPPTPGTDEEGFYCESCGTAWTNPEKVVGPCMIHKMGAAPEPLPTVKED